MNFLLGGFLPSALLAGQYYERIIRFAVFDYPVESYNMFGIELVTSVVQPGAAIEMTRK